MSAKHTPGPWTKNRDWQLTGSNGHRVGAWGLGVAAVNKSDEAVANATLIAAAPDLLETLERIAAHGHADDCNLLNYANGQCDCGIDDALKVIAKAKGEKP
jgi:hypothetical protein